MTKYSKLCGPDAKDEYDDFCECRSNSKTIYSRRHFVSGNGIITSCNANNSGYNYEEAYHIYDGITELGDGCLNKGGIESVLLPSTLQKIGNMCFRNTKITRISLPDGLKEIGDKNFPSTLLSIKIPRSLEYFPISNILICDKISSIEVDASNKSYQSVDGILYNYDMTEILFCPNGKDGKVIIPRTVERIGDYCFYNCTKISSIIIPPTVKNIGDYAFSNVSMEKLIIPNSVIKIGEGCFEKALVKSCFNLAAQITSISSQCFHGADIPSSDFLKRMRSIGKGAFDARGTANILPAIVSLQSVEHIGEDAFNQQTDVEVFELFSCLEQIDAGAFMNTAKSLRIRYFSFVPIEVDIDAFKGIGGEVTLIVPPKTKLIFENTAPWSSFDNIEEMELNSDMNEDGLDAVTDEIHLNRLRSVVDSISNVGRVLIQETIENIALNYIDIETEEEYEEAIQLLDYNRTFSPAIVADLEKNVCQHWSNKYKLRIMSRAIFNIASPSLLISMPVKKEETATIVSLPLTTVECAISQSKKLGSSNLISTYFGEIQKHIQNELSLATSSIKVAVSWFTNYALFKQIKELPKNGIKVQIVINNDSINNGGYCLNLNELIDAGIELSLVEYPHLLHHKFCIIDDQLVINGSYNWTRFSESNYENIVVIRDDMNVVKDFCQEFDIILDNAEHKNINKMPEFVSERPEYDRSAFKQYITEELDAEARATSNQRDKITALQRAAKLNPEYLEKINPTARKEYEEAFKVLEQSVSVAEEVVAMVENERTELTNHPLQMESIAKSAVLGTRNPAKITHKAAMIINKIQTSAVFLVLDVSGSMSNTFSAGHVHNIAKKTLAAALAISKTKEVALWTFGDNSTFIANIGLENIESVKNVCCKNEGTELRRFTTKAAPCMTDGALVIIFTDDDGVSISNAISGIQAKENVFWQIIVYGTSHDKISNAISSVKNASIKSLTDYASKSETEINQLLLKDYIDWKKNQS